MKMLAIAVLCMAVPTLAAQVEIVPSPVPLDGLFHVVVRGDIGLGDSVTVLNLRTMEHVTLDLTCAGDRWVTEAVQAVRTCVCESAEAAARLDVQLGDTLVAATEAGEGRSTTTRVSYRERIPGEPHLFLRRFDTEEMDFVYAGVEIPSGLYAIEIHDARKDVSCDLDTIEDVPGAFGREELLIDLEEIEVASGRFMVMFQLDIYPVDQELRVVLSNADGEIVMDLPWEKDLWFGADYGHRVVAAEVVPLAVSLSETQLSLPVGCSHHVYVIEPDDADEYRWYEDGKLLSTDDRVTVGGFVSHDWKTVTAFARSGVQWGVAEFTYRVTPPPTVSFRDPATGQVARQPWPSTGAVQIMLEDVYTGEAPVVDIGVLGGDRQHMTLETQVNEATWVSAAFRPVDRGWYAGDVLWVEYKDKDGCSAAHTYATLRLK